MLKLIRVVLLLVIAAFMINLVIIGIATSATGPLEKVVLGVVGLALVFAAVKVHRIGAPRTTRA